MIRYDVAGRSSYYIKLLITVTFIFICKEYSISDELMFDERYMVSF